MPGENMGLFIGDIPFFEDYFLWLRCKKEARKKGQKFRYFIVRCVQDYLASNDDKFSINTPERFHDACELRAKQDNATIASVIEKACIAKIGVIYNNTMNTPQIEKPTKKGSFFDLNRDAK